MLNQWKQRAGFTAASALESLLRSILSTLHCSEWLGFNGRRRGRDMSVFCALVIAWFYLAAFFTVSSIFSAYIKTKSWSEALFIQNGALASVKTWAIIFPLMPILYTTVVFKKLFEKDKN